jgi:hypothetical protein
MKVLHLAIAQVQFLIKIQGEVSKAAGIIVEYSYVSRSLVSYMHIVFLVYQA